MYDPRPIVNMGYSSLCFSLPFAFNSQKSSSPAHLCATLTLSFMAPSQPVWNRPQTIPGFADGTSHCLHGTRQQSSGCDCVF